MADQTHPLDVPFRDANPLSASEPKVPDLDPRTVIYEAGSVNAEDAFPLPCDIRADLDVAIPIRNGVVLYGDVYRPNTEQPVPVLLAYTPYSKRGGWWNLHFNATNFGVPKSAVSGLQGFEAPDPGFWVDHDYAVVYVDAAGTSRSGGDEVFMGSASGRNVHDVIEWVADQPWCTGKVALVGNSQLAMVQWCAAAEQPPHLTAIAPWEGVSDIYREVSVRGGIPDTKFHVEDIAQYIYGLNRTEDLTGSGVDEHPLYDEYWADKKADLTQVTVPAYVVASWSSPVHTQGTLRAFRELGSEQKWLRVHNNQEWLDTLDPASVQDLLRFFDHVMKGADNGWSETPRVRLSVLDPGGHDDVNRPEQTWPLSQVTNQTLYLDAGSGELVAARVDTSNVAEYAGNDLTASVRFVYSVTEETEIIGSPNLRLWVQGDGADLDLFAALYKESADGTRLHHITLTSPGARAHVESLAHDGMLPATLSYTGPVGRLRVSHRALDTSRSTKNEPVLTHASEQLLEPGEVVQVDLGLWPTALKVHPGERLVVEIAGHAVGPLAGPNLPGGWLGLPTRNTGIHRILTGGDHESCLILPVNP